MNKKAQIKFGESFGIIIIVFIILIIGMVWYNKVNTDSINELALQDMYDRAFERYYYMVNLDLIHVSERGIIDDEYDINSLRVFANYSNTDRGKNFLKKQLGESLITIEIFNYSDVRDGNLENVSEFIILYNQTSLKNKKILRNEIFRTLVPVVNLQEKRTDLGVLKVEVPFTG